MNFNKPTALLGGSFDPPHLGHLHIASECLQNIPALETIYFLPAAQHPDKQANASAKLRQKMLEIALEDTDFKIWDYEIQKTGKSFSVETLEECHRLGAKREKLYWIMGSDCYLDFSDWHKPDRIRELATLVVVNRPESEIHQQDSRDQILTIPPVDFASTFVRNELKNDKIPAKCLPLALENYLKERILNKSNPYGSTKS